MTRPEAREILGYSHPRISAYRDGGTISLKINGTEYTVDQRGGTTTRGSFYLGHPEGGLILSFLDPVVDAIITLLPDWLEEQKRQTRSLEKIMEYT